MSGTTIAPPRAKRPKKPVGPLITAAKVLDKGERELVITIVGDSIELRPRGLNHHYRVRLAQIYQRAVADRVGFDAGPRRTR